MQISQKNYKEGFEAFRNIISSPKTEFIAFDFEMSGIRTQEKESFNDMPFERYEKCANVARKYCLIQVGISVFYKEGDNAYVCHPFNAFIIQRKIEGTTFVPEFVLESGAIRFNAEHGMDFDLWIKQGITYLDRDTQRALITNIEQHQKLRPNEKTEIIQRIHAAAGFTEVFELISKRGVPVVGHNCYMDLLFLYNSFISPLSKQFSSSNAPSSTSNNEDDDDEDGKSSGKQPSFKETLNRFLPLIFDSKAMANAFLRDSMGAGEKSTSLENIKEFIYKDLATFRTVSVKLATGCEDYDWDIPGNGKKFHEAGFDSYLTGWVFLQLRQFYLNNKHTLAEFNRTFQNQVNVMNNRFFLSLGQEDDHLQSSAIDNLIEADALFILEAHGVHADPTKAERLQKDIQEHISGQSYPFNVRVSIQNQIYVFVELALQDIKDKEQSKSLKEKITQDVKKFSHTATFLSLKEYVSSLLQAKQNGNKGGKFNGKGGHKKN